MRFLMSGDEDVRVGVQIAQNYGVRVHLLGVAPSRGNQSLQLIQEADTTQEWDQAKIGTFLFERPVAAKSAAPAVPALVAVAGIEQQLETAVKDLVEALELIELEAIQAYWQQGQRGVPADQDKRLLPHCRAAIGRNLERAEIHLVRGHFQRMAKVRLGG
jgi:hypothetical protein